MSSKLEKFKLNLVFTDNARKMILEHFSQLNLKAENSFTAEELFRKTLNPQNYYHARINFLREGTEGDDIYQLKIAASDDLTNQKLLSLFQEEVLVLEGLEKDDKQFLLTSVKLFSSDFGFKKEKESYLKFYTPQEAAYYNTGFPDGWLEELKVENITGENFSRNIEAWKAYLNESIEIAKEKNFILDYNGYLDFLDRGEIVFSLISELSQEVIEKISQAYQKRIYLHPDSSHQVARDQDSDGIYIGDLKNFDQENRRLHLELSDDSYLELKNNKLHLPQSGSLEYKPLGSLVGLDRQLGAIRRAENFEAVNKRLAAFLFDIDNLRLPTKEFELAEAEFFNQRLNKKQKEAVEKIINTEELTLLKGPPGTGKTTVITEACYQLAKRDKKVLISSQTNLAVDNVFSNLKDIMSAGEKVYPLRFGSISSFESEGEEFARENVLNTWLKNSAQSSKMILEQKKAKIENYKEIKEVEQKLKKYLKALEKERSLETRKKNINEELESLKSLIEYNKYFQLISADYDFYLDYSEKQQALKEKREELFKIGAEIESRRNEYNQKQNQQKKIETELQEIKNYLNLLIDSKLNFKKWAQDQIEFKFEKYSLDYQTLPQKLLPEAEKFTLEAVWTEFKNQLQQELNKIAAQRQQIELLTDDYSALNATAELLKTSLADLKDDYPEVNNLKMSDLAFKFGNQNPLEQFFVFEEGKISGVESGSYRKISSYLKSNLGENKEKIWYQLKLILFKLNKSTARINAQLEQSQEFKKSPWEYINKKIIEILADNLKTYQKKLNKEYIMLKDKSSQLKNSFSSLQIKENKIEEKIKDLEKKLQVTAELEQLIKLEAQLSGKFKKLKELYQQLISLLQQEEVPNWKEDFQTVKDELDSKLKLKDLRTEELQAAAAAEQKNLEELESELIQLGSELKAFQSEWEKIRSQISYYKNEDKEMTAEQLKLLLEKLDSEFNSFDSDLKYIERYDNLISAWAKELKEKNIKRPSLLDSYLKRVNIVGTTCSKAASAKFFNQFERFDYVIIDEVSKATIPELLMPIITAEKVILIGDDKQLPPLVSKDIIDKLEAKSAPVSKEMLLGSYFKELWQKADPKIKVMLNKQYRMHSDIMAVINQFYQGQLLSGVAREAQTKNHGLQLDYLKEDQHALWIQTPPVLEWEEEEVGTSYKNINEVKLIDQILADIERKSREDDLEQDIGVITFYRPQFDLLRNQLQPKYKDLNLRLGTVDRFQGMESDIIIVSMVRNNREYNIGFAKTFERINVALSRARKLLILVGNTHLFCRDNRDQDSREIYDNIAAIIDQKEGLIDVSEVIYR